MSGIEDIMVKNKLCVISIFGVIFLSLLISSFGATGQAFSTSSKSQSCFLYDDFSSGNLNANKWSEHQDPEGQPFMGEHFVDTVLLNYHTQNIGTHDQRVVLNLISHTFLPGDKLTYKVNNVAGSGTRGAFIYVNGGPANRIGGLPPGCDLNVDLDKVGTHRLELNFHTSGINVTLLAPDNSTRTCSIPITTWNYGGNIYSSAPPWNIGVESFKGSGSGDTIHVDFDDFRICANQQPPLNMPPIQFPPPNIVASWNFDEGTGSMAYDSTPNGNDGNLVGGPTWTAESIRGYALEFDGIDDFIRVTRTPSVDVTEKVVLEAYVKRKSAADGTIISKNGPYLLGIKDNKTFGGIYTSGWTHIKGKTDLQIGVWYKLKLVYDGARIRLYVNDLLDRIKPKTGQMPVVSQSVFLAWGEPGQNFYFNGTIDEAKIYGK